MIKATQRPSTVSVADYMDRELHSAVKHEYLAGQVVAMSAESEQHALIAGVLFALLLPLARQRDGQLFVSDMKVRVEHAGNTWFYYPDLLLTCDPLDRESPDYKRNPCLLAEVLSPETEATDTGEKLLAYRLLPSLHEYLLLHQDKPRADLYQRNVKGHWQHLRLERPDQALPLQSLPVALTLADLYPDFPDVRA